MNFHDLFIEIPTLETERTILRKLNENDAEDLAEMGRDEEFLKYIEGFPNTEEEARKWISIWNGEAYDAKGHIRWGIELKEEKKIIGSVYFCFPVGSRESGYRTDIGYSLSRKYWNRGIMTEAVKKVTEYIFQSSDLRRIQAHIHYQNTASIMMCKKAGFHEDGLLKYFYYDLYNKKLLHTVIMSRVSE